MLSRACGSETTLAFSRKLGKLSQALAAAEANALQARAETVFTPVVRDFLHCAFGSQVALMRQLRRSWKRVSRRRNRLAWRSGPNKLQSEMREAEARATAEAQELQARTNSVNIVNSF